MNMANDLVTLQAVTCLLGPSWCNLEVKYDDISRLVNESQPSVASTHLQ